MPGGDRSVAEMIETALYYRDQCLEWAAVSPSPEAALKLQDAAVGWAAFAATLRQEAEAIADSRRLLEEAKRLLNGRLVVAARMGPKKIQEGRRQN
jgi:hypothetical protein